jgi:hypothetical protein
MLRCILPAMRHGVAHEVHAAARSGGVQRGCGLEALADDYNIYVSSRPTGEKVMASVNRFLTNKLRLKRPSPKALDKFKGRIRDMTRRTRGSVQGNESKLTKHASRREMCTLG